MMTRHIQFGLLVSAILGLMGSVIVVWNRISSRANGAANSASIGHPQPHFPPQTENDERKARLIYERTYPTGTIPADAQEKAWRAISETLERQSREPDGIGAPDHWTNIGPAPIMGGAVENPVGVLRTSGRVVDIAVDPTLPASHWFIAANGGGIWETTDGGASWSPKTDGNVVTTWMRFVTLAESNPQIVFAATHPTIWGTGLALVRSTNGGTTWSAPLATTSFPSQYGNYFISLKVDPTNPDNVVAMTSFGGVFRSTNQGNSFVQTLSEPGRALERNSMSFNLQYAATCPGGTTNKVYRSYDAGATWSEVAGPWHNQSGRYIKIAPGPQSAPSTVYLIADVAIGNEFGRTIWKLPDAWQAGAPAYEVVPMPTPPPGDVEVAMVDPTNDKVLYIGGGNVFNFYRKNADDTWAQILSGTHVDQRAMSATVTSGPTPIPMLLLGNDGGFWTSTDSGTTWINKNSNLSTVELAGSSVSSTAALGGSTDNGTELWTGTTAWTYKDHGDGERNAFSFTDPDHYWLMINNIYFHRTWVNPTGVPYNCASGLTEKIVTVKRSPHNNDLLAGSTPVDGVAHLWKSTNFFDPFPAPPDCPSSAPTWTLHFNGSPQPPSIGGIAFAPSDTSSQTYAFAAESALWLTTNNGAKWKDIDPNPGMVPNRFVTSIAFHPLDPATIYVALSGFDGQTPGSPGHIFKTVNAMARIPTWTNVTPPGLDLPVNALAIEPVFGNTIYAGTDVGIWKSSTAAPSWTFMLTSGMPNVQTTDLLFTPVNPAFPGIPSRLIAFTYGRGAFALNVGSLQVTINPPGAVNNGAKWRIDGGAWQDSGATVVGLAPGTGIHTLSFKSVSGYNTPPNQSISINMDMTTQATGVYVPPSQQESRVQPADSD